VQLVQAFPKASVTAHALAQLCQFRQCRVRAAAAVEQPINLVHNRTERAQLSVSSHKLLDLRPLTRGHVVANKEVSVVEKLRDAMLNVLCLPAEAFGLGRVLGTASWQLGSLCGKLLAEACKYSQYRLGQFLEDVELADLVRELPKDLSYWLRIEGRGVGRDPAHNATVCGNRFPQPFQEATNVFVLRIMLKHLVQQAALTLAIDDRQDAEWAVIQLVCGHVAGEIG